jgi:hypothetical protein
MDPTKDPPGDTIPSPPDVDMLEAAAADLDDVVAALEVAQHNLVNVASNLRRQAAELRGAP